MIKSHLEKHNLTPKHLRMINGISSVSSVSSASDDIIDAIEVYGNDIAFLKAENIALKLALEECKQMFKNNYMPPPTSTPPTQPPTHIIIQNPSESVKIVDETCNPRYIEKELNNDPANDNTPDIHLYFSFKQKHVVFDFDDVEDMVDVDKGYAIDKITAFVKSNLKNHIAMPFKFVKSSWYVKQKDGWERHDNPNNKSKMPSGSDYSHNIILLKFLFIIQNRFMSHFDQIDPQWKCQSETHSTRLLSEVFNPSAYKNSDILRHISDLY
jgi:hypothetical protein